MIINFKDKNTERFYNGQNIPQFTAFSRVAERKLDQLDAATSVRDLACPSGNRLERLHGDRQNQWSIRINDQWRICFEWPENSPGPTNIEIIDYH